MPLGIWFTSPPLSYTPFMLQPSGTTGTPSVKQVSVFLSYNSADHEFVRRLAAALAVAGAHVWFDEWTIRPGDQIPGAIDQGLGGFDTFALIWSERSSRSQWVKAEMEAAVIRWNNEDTIRLIPVLLDGTPLPVLLRPVRYIDAIDGDHLRVTRELLGIGSETEFRLAVQAFISEAGLEFREFKGVGVLVACPSCGASPDSLDGWQDVDDQRDDLYAGARCRKCGWSDGSEV